MVAREFKLRHNGDEFPIEYDTDDGLEVLKFQIFSLTSVEPDDQQILAEDERLLVDESTDLNALSAKLRLVSIEEAKDLSKSSKSQEMSDENLAQMLQAEEEALLLQQYSAMDNGKQFRSRVEPYVKQVLMYERPIRQEAARKTVPVDELEEKALVSLAKEGNFNPSKDEKDHSFLLQLLLWFKQSFSWVNAPPCDKCGHETSNIGMGAPLPSEIEYDASIVEVYRCNRCSSRTRFPRYNDPLKLVETRRGRCGEWANCFTLYCRAFGYDARLIMDFTDHVWTECYSQVHGRWMHLDPCEGIYDNPLLYEKGWGKKLNYVIGIAKDGVHDVTRRYTKKWHEVLSRRIIATESAVASVLSSITKQCRRNYSAEALSILADRDRRELDELQNASYLNSDSESSLPGRQSGSAEWRKSRSELGLTETEALGLSSCPVRKCVDAHVSAIYDAFSLLLSQLGDRTTDVMEVLKDFLLDIKSRPFKERKTSLDLKPFEISEKMKGCIEKLLDSLSLKGEWGDDGVVRVAVTGNPVNTSLALPVALDLVDEVINSYKNKVYQRDGITFPKPNRLCSGMVIASGEQLPFGIATAAFEGTRANKWEEPNGAKGCWLIYKASDCQMYSLESYDLMSANDAPERDPMDWVLEASTDGGSSWTVIDRQSSQLFENRFSRKSFKIGTRLVANTFRFRVLSVRDCNSQPRFQIGAIDLYAAPNSSPSKTENLQNKMEDERLLVDESTDLNALSAKLRLVSIEEAKDLSKSSKSQEMSDEELAQMLQAEEEALLLQQYSAMDNGEQFRSRVEPYVKQVLMYESPIRQEAARKTVPVDELEEKALVSLAKEGNFNPSKDEKDHSFLIQLLVWFQQSFSWVNAPPCDKCGHETSNIGMGAPLPSEIEYGASRVEVYRCNRCSSTTRFPRYSDPLKLVETRSGRCGEWANCFTLYCRAFGYDARLIKDFTDHVWTECYSQVHGRWMHLDPCEGIDDNPLLYEKGWGKKLNYVIGIAKDGVHDVTRRYTKKLHEVLSRRIIATESAVASVLSSITKQCRRNYSAEALSILADRDRRELDELQNASYLNSDSESSLPGRQSGSAEWRKSRSELGLTETEALGLSSCPVRKCVDAHVSAIYDAFSLLLSQLGDRTTDVMEVLKDFLLDIKSRPFKERKTSLDLKPFEISEKMKGCIEKLLDSLSLKGEWGDDGVVRVAVTGNPVNTSLALPVALDLVDEVINSYKNKVYQRDGITFPKPNRLCSGMVIASGEQLPFGIATAAFEGTRANKWVEPNGAKGCWLIYKVSGCQMYSLESYDLMSANDAPERDPMDWVLEATTDGGSSWTVIDRQGSQLFENRFSRKSFKIGTRLVANTFRFRVLSVRDCNSQPRFQIGAIDLYAAPNSSPSKTELAK